jgi:putative hemolysin
MSFLYYALAQVSAELRNITLFHELLRKRGDRYRLAYGDPIDPGALPQDVEEATLVLKRASLALV